MSSNPEASRPPTTPRRSLYDGRWRLYSLLGIAAAVIATFILTSSLYQTGKTHTVIIPSGAFLPPSDWTPGELIFDDKYFSPSQLTIDVGNVVRWINRDTVTHTVTLVRGPNGGIEFDHVLNPSSAFEARFTVAGEYVYICTIHPWQAGKVIVRIK